MDNIDQFLNSDKSWDEALRTSPPTAAITSIGTDGKDPIDSFLDSDKSWDDIQLAKPQIKDKIDQFLDFEIDLKPTDYPGAEVDFAKPTTIPSAKTSDITEPFDIETGGAMPMFEPMIPEKPKSYGVTGTWDDEKRGGEPIDIELGGAIPVYAPKVPESPYPVLRKLESDIKTIDEYLKNKHENITKLEGDFEKYGVTSGQGRLPTTDLLRDKYVSAINSYNTTLKHRNELVDRHKDESAKIEDVYKDYDFHPLPEGLGYLQKPLEWLLFGEHDKPSDVSYVPDMAPGSPALANILTMTPDEEKELMAENPTLMAMGYALTSMGLPGISEYAFSAIDRENFLKKSSQEQVDEITQVGVAYAVFGAVMKGASAIGMSILSHNPGLAELFTTPFYLAKKIGKGAELPKEIKLSPQDIIDIFSGKAEAKEMGGEFRYPEEAETAKIFNELGFSNNEIKKAIKTGGTLKVPATELKILQDRDLIARIKEVFGKEPFRKIEGREYKFGEPKFVPTEKPTEPGPVVPTPEPPIAPESVKVAPEPVSVIEPTLPKTERFVFEPEIPKVELAPIGEITGKQAAEAVNKALPGHDLKFDGVQEDETGKPAFYQFTAYSGPAARATFSTESLAPADVQAALEAKVKQFEAARRPATEPIEPTQPEPAAPAETKVPEAETVWVRDVKLEPRTYQEKYPEKTVHEDWDKANSPRFDFEAAGDILREFQKKDSDAGYINEKLNRVERFLKGEISGKLHSDDSLSAAVKHVPEKLNRLISQYEHQPTKTANEKLAKDLILNTLKGNFKEAQGFAEAIRKTISTPTEAKPAPAAEPAAKAPFRMTKKEFIKDEDLAVINNESEGPKPNKYKEGDLLLDGYGENPYVYQMQYIDPKTIEISLEGESRQRVINMPSTQKYIEWAKEGIEPTPISVVLKYDNKKPFSTNRRRVIAAQEAGVNRLPAFVEIGRHKDVIKQALTEGDLTPAEAVRIHKEAYPDIESWPEMKAAVEGGKTEPVAKKIKTEPVTPKPEKIVASKVEAKPTKITADMLPEGSTVKMKRILDNGRIGEVTFPAEEGIKEITDNDVTIKRLTDLLDCLK